METGLFTSLVLSTFPKSTIAFVIPPTVPVKVGLFKGAFKFKELLTSVAFAFNAKELVKSELFAFSARPLVTSEAFAFNDKAVLTSTEFAFKAKPGTVGAAALPAKSPAN